MLSFVAGGNLGHTAFQNAATPVQNNGSIYDVIYTYSKGSWIVQPYFQYTNVPTDLKIGVVPVINLEWIQKLHRDRKDRGYTAEAVTDTILRRMPDYVNYICPQFAETDINFQRVPTVDTSNPFIARWIPTPDESMVVIRLKNPRGIDFPYLLSMIPHSFMSRANSIVIPGSKLDLAMQLILTPLILQLIERKRRSL